MKVEVVCSSCQRSFLIHERLMASGSGDVPCPSCGSAMVAPAPSAPRPVRVAAPAPKAAAKPPAAKPAATAQTAPPAPSTGAQSAPAAAGAAAVAVAAAPLPTGEPEACVCPRCGLHFQPKAADPATEGTRPTVLVVEDMEYFREIARDALSTRFEVVTADNAEDAWRTLTAGGVSLLVLDLTLGGSENGRRLLEQIKVKPCPVLIFTSRDESEMYGDEWDELQALGADDMVIKGMNVGESLMRKACDLVGLTDGDLALD